MVLPDGECGRCLSQKDIGRFLTPNPISLYNFEHIAKVCIPVI